MSSPPGADGVKSSSVYEHTLALIRCQSEGLVDTPAYESALRKAYGPNAPIAFTVDRLLQHIVKQVRGMGGEGGETGIW